MRITLVFLLFPTFVLNWSTYQKWGENGFTQGWDDRWTSNGCYRCQSDSFQDDWSGLWWGYSRLTVNFKDKSEIKKNCTCWVKSNKACSTFVDSGRTSTNIKTIIFATTHHRKNDGTSHFKYLVCGNSNWCIDRIWERGTQLCSDCPFGYLDTTDANGNGIDIRAAYIKPLNNGEMVGICHQFMYDYENWLRRPATTLSYYHFNLGGTASINPTDFLTLNNMVNSEDKDYNGFLGYNHEPTCVWWDRGNINQDEAKTTFFVIDFGYHLRVREFFLSKGNDLILEWWVPDMNDRRTATATASELASDIFSVNKISMWDHPNQRIKKYLRSQSEDVASFKCENDPCEDYMTSRVILASEPDKSFTVCGLAVMGELMPCPATQENCKHTYVNPPDETISDMIFPNLGSTILSDEFLFSDPMTDQCGTGQGCTDRITYQLWCYDCPDSTCADQNDLTLYTNELDVTTYSIDWQLQADDRHIILSVTSPNQDIRTIDMRCVIYGEVHQFGQYSNSFLLQEPCLPCELTTIYDNLNDFPWTTEFIDIAVGSAGVQEDWLAFKHSANSCPSSSGCQNIEYEPECKLDSELDTEFRDISDYFTPMIYAGAGDQMVMDIRSTKKELHGLTFNCRIKSYHPQSSDVYYAPVFDVSFNICIDPVQSCQYNSWDQPPIGWAQPMDMNIFVSSGEVISSIFSYADWKDDFYTLCNNTPVCGDFSFQYVVYNNDGTQTQIMTPSASPLHQYDQIDNTSDETLSLSILTEDDTMGGSYRVKIVGTLDCGPKGLDSSNCLSVTWTSFKLNIVNVCMQLSPCMYTSVINNLLTTFTTMTAFVDNLAVSQEYIRWSDKVTGLGCDSVPDTGCQVMLYKLIYVADLSIVPSDLATIISTSEPPKVRVKTTNYDYCGTHTVKIKGEMVVSGNSVAFAYSNDFDIIIDCCDTKSCIYTELIPHDSMVDSLPTDYTIGVDNVMGKTSFSYIQNKCGVGCPSNPSVCGNPVYTLEMVDGSTLPTFLNNVQQLTLIEQQSQTFDINDEGSFRLKMKVELAKSSFGNGVFIPDDVMLYTDDWEVIVDVCQPLPCNYNKILTPESGMIKPSDLSYKTDNIAVTTTFDYYKDEVSERCWSRSFSSYKDLCGPKLYVVQKIDGTSMPPTAGVQPSPGATTPQAQCNDVTRQCTVTGQSTDNAVYGNHNVRIHASIASATDTLVSAVETSVEFVITILRHPLCDYVEPSINAIVPVDDCTIYLCPSDFTIYTTDVWGYTYFDSWNDTYTEECFDRNGRYSPDGGGTWISQSPFTNFPVLGVIGSQYDVYPFYTLVDAVTLEPMMPTTFEQGDIAIEFDSSTEFTKQFSVGARTTRASLVGEHQVKVMIQRLLTSAPFYSNEFTITVIDPCKPIVCEEVIYQPDDPATPEDLLVKIGEGYVPKEMSYWTSSHAQWCGDSAVWATCGTPTFTLINVDTGSPIAEFLWKIDHTINRLRLQVMITDEELVGQAFNVYILVSPPNEVGIGGQTQDFIIQVSNEIVRPPDQPPKFESFPANIVYTLIEGESNDPQYFEVQSVCYDDEGAVTDIQVSDVPDFVNYSIQNPQVNFQISLNEDLKLGKSEISVECTDEAGSKTKKSFTIEIKAFKKEDLSAGQIFENIQPEDEEEEEKEVKPPIEVKVKSISVTGVMVIGYSRAVIPVNFTTFDWHNTTQFSITFEQRSNEEDQTSEFKFEVIGMTPTEIKVQLLFVRPLDISQGIKPDIVHIKMLKEVLLIEAGEQLWVNTGTDIDYVMTSGLVPKQVEDEEMFEQLEASASYFGKIASIFFYLPLGFHIIGIGSMDMTWVLFRQLQIFEIFSQFDLKLPANVVVITQSYSNMAHQQIIPPLDVYDYVKVISADDKKQIEESGPQQVMGWECNGNYCDHKLVNRTLSELQDNANKNQKTDSVQQSVEEGSQISEFDQSRFANRGSSDLVLIPMIQMLVLIISVILLGLCGIILRYTFFFWCPASFKQSYEYVKHRIFWNLPLRVLIQQYVIVSISIFLNFRYRAKQQGEDFNNRLAAGFMLAFYTILFPLVTLYILFKYHYKWEMPFFARNYDSLTISLYVHHAWSAIMYSMGMIRMCIMIFVAVAFDWSLLQFALSLYVQEFYTSYVLGTKPMKEPWRNFVEYYNEIFLFIQIILMCTLTDFVPSPAIRYNVTGWLMIYIMYIQFTINAVLLVYQLFASIRMSYFKYRLAWWQRKMSKLNPLRNKESREDKLSEVSSYLKQYEDPDYLHKQAAKKDRKPKYGSKLLEMIEEQNSQESNSSQPNYQKVIAIRRKQFQDKLDNAKEIDQKKTTYENEWFTPRTEKSADKSGLSQHKWQAHSIDKDDKKNWYALPKELQGDSQVDLTESEIDFRQDEQNAPRNGKGQYKNEDDSYKMFDSALVSLRSNPANFFNSRNNSNQISQRQVKKQNSKLQTISENPSAKNTNDYGNQIVKSVTLPQQKEESVKYGEFNIDSLVLSGRTSKHQENEKPVPNQDFKVSLEDDSLDFNFSNK